MGTMEHECMDCFYAEFNNSSYPRVCPKCGGEMSSRWDEELDVRDESENYDPSADGGY